MEATRDAEVSDMEIEEKCRSQPPFGRSCARESTATVTALSAPRSRFFSSERRAASPGDGWERHFPSEISISLTSASLVACMFASNYSSMSRKEKLCQHSKHIPNIN
ncbi:unnamed protein product [Coccothraustes coccothraustes]